MSERTGNRFASKGFASMQNSYLQKSIDILAERFGKYDMRYVPAPHMPGETYFPWYGRDDEEIMVCVFKGGELHETFHRHDFFFFNYAWRGDYDTISFQRDNLVTIHEGELYLGQPFTGYALRGNPREEVTIVGVLIRKETFYESFTPMAAGSQLLDFFVDPLRDPTAEQFTVLHPDPDFPIAELLSFMICEYAHEQLDTQALLKSYAHGCQRRVCANAGLPGAQRRASKPCRAGRTIRLPPELPFHAVQKRAWENVHAGSA